MDSKTDSTAASRISRCAIPMLSIHAVHFTLQSSFQAHYSTAAMAGDWGAAGRYGSEDGLTPRSLPKQRRRNPVVVSRIQTGR